MKVLDPQLLASISDLKIIGKLIAQGVMTGTHTSKFKGFNIEFAEYRQYQFSDELKFIDWKLFGRTDKMYVKQFIDETELNAVIAIDTSSSMDYKDKMKYAFYLASGLSYIFYRQNDYQSCILFNDRVEKSSDMRKAIEGFSRTINIMQDYKKEKNRSGTDLKKLIDYLNANIEKRYILFLISDLWIEEKDIRNILNIAAQRNEIYIIHLLDEDEIKLSIPEHSLLIDRETNLKLKLDKKLITKVYLKKITEYIEKLKKTTSIHNIKYNLITTKNPVDANLRELLIR